MVTLEGLAQLLDETEKEDFVQATQSFLRSQGDETSIAEFVSQRLLSTIQRSRRGLLVSGLVVDTRIVSWEDETPGQTAVDMITSMDSTFVDVLQSQNEGTFAAVENVIVVPGSESTPSSPLTKDYPSDDPSDKGKTVLVAAIVVISVVLVFGGAVFCCDRRVRRMTTNPRQTAPILVGGAMIPMVCSRQTADEAQNDEDWSDEEPKTGAMKNHIILVGD